MDQSSHECFQDIVLIIAAGSALYPSTSSGRAQRGTGLVFTADLSDDMSFEVLTKKEALAKLELLEAGVPSESNNVAGGNDIKTVLPYVFVLFYFQSAEHFLLFFLLIHVVVPIHPPPEL